MKTEKSPFLSKEEIFKIRLERSYTERFRSLMQLIELSRKLKEAKIIEAEK